MKQLLTTILIVTSLFTYSQPPARTWFKDKYGRKTDIVHQRWDENSDGLKHGKFIEYSSKGERSILGFYSQGKKTGTWTETNHGTTETYIYVNNVLDGKNVKKYDSGKVIFQGNYVNGNKDGDWYEREGFATGAYKKGKRNGWWKDQLVSVSMSCNKGSEYIKSFDDSNIDFDKCSGFQVNDYSLVDLRGAKTLYENGKITISLDIHGTDAFEWVDYQNCKYSSLKFSNFEEFSLNKAIKDCGDFNKTYGSSKYSQQVAGYLTVLESERNKRKSANTSKEKALTGDIDAIKAFYGENSDLVKLHFVVNNSYDKIKITFPKGWGFENHFKYDEEDKDFVTCYKAILKNSKNLLATSLIREWEKVHGNKKMAMVYCSWNPKSGYELKWSQYDGSVGYYNIYGHSNAYSSYYIKGKHWQYIFRNGKQIGAVLPDKWFKDFSNKSSIERYAILYTRIAMQDELDMKGLNFYLKSSMSLDTEGKNNILNYLIGSLQNVKVVLPTKIHDSKAVKTVFLSLLYWELGEEEKSLTTLKTSKSTYKKYNDDTETWGMCSVSEYMRDYIKREFDEKNLTRQKDFLKALKKL